MGSSEFALLELLRPLLDGEGPGVVLGPGDDAAVVEVGGSPVAVTVDTLVEDVHFDRALSSWEDVGWKALAVNVSDLAAVGARPVAAVVSLQRPASLDDAAAVGLYRGLREAAGTWSVALLGGDTTGGAQLAVSVTLLGVPPAGGALRRDGARPGEVVGLVGEVGLAAAGLAAWRADAPEVLAAHPELLAAHRRPRALVSEGGALADSDASACIDVSDGLGRDLGHLARSSGVRIVLERPRLVVAPGVRAVADRLRTAPLDLAVAGGDDYALAFTAPPASFSRVSTALEAVGSRPRLVGQVQRGTGVVLVGGGEPDEPVGELGWQH